MTGRLAVFGEVLFDQFPDGTRVLGGAPFNVAWHLQAFGRRPRFISRVGDDPEGEAVRGAMSDWGMDPSDLQTDPELPTGQVRIRFTDGEPAYEIVHPSAYDAIEPPPNLAECGLVYHGTLALRSAASRRSVAELKAGGSPTIFLDVNLRPPWWSRDQVLELVRDAAWVKLNHDELQQLAGPGASVDRFLGDFGLQGLVLTRGSDGADLLTAGGARHSITPHASVTVVDTVGAGDAFASVIILGLELGWPFETMLERAQSFASAVVGRRGATVADPCFYRPFINHWDL